MKARGYFFPSDNSRVHTTTTSMTTSTTSEKIISGASQLEWTESKGKYVRPSNSENLNIVLRPSRATTFARVKLGEWTDSRVNASTTTLLKNSDWPLKNGRSSGDAVSPLTSEFFAIVWLSRLVGCHPSLTSGVTFVTSALVKLWSLVWIVGLGVAIALELRNLYLCRVYGSTTDALCTLTIMDRLMVLGSHVICVTVAVVKASDFDVATRRIQNFDEATFHGTKFDVRMNVGAIVAFIAASTALSYVYYAPIGEEPTSVVIYSFCMCVMTLELHKCCFVYVALLRRFVKLKALALTGKIDVGVTKGVYYQTLTVQHVFVMNHWLTEAVNNFNSYFGVQIVYWIIHFVVNMVVYMFRLSVMALTMDIEFRQYSRFFVSIYLLGLICIVGHFTCKRANELGRLLFGRRVQSLDTTYSSLEILELGYYLHYVPVRVTGMKMFNVDMPLLLSILEVTATYAAFIVQNAEDIYNKFVVNNGTEIK